MSDGDGDIDIDFDSGSDGGGGGGGESDSDEEVYRTANSYAGSFADDGNETDDTLTPLSEKENREYNAVATGTKGLICWQQLNREYAVNLYRDSVALRASLIVNKDFVVNGIKALPNLTKAELSIFFDESFFKDDTVTKMFQKRLELLNRVNEVQMDRRKNENLDDIETHAYGHGWLWLTGYLIGADGDNKTVTRANQLTNVNTFDVDTGPDAIQKRTRLKNITNESFLDLLGVEDAVALVSKVGPAWFLLGTLLARQSKPDGTSMVSTYWKDYEKKQFDETIDEKIKQDIEQDIKFINDWMSYSSQPALNTFIAERPQLFRGVKDRLAALIKSTQEVLEKELNLFDQIDHATRRVYSYDSSKPYFDHVTEQATILLLQKAFNPAIGSLTNRTMMWSRLANLNTVLDDGDGIKVDAAALRIALNANDLAVGEGRNVHEPDTQDVFEQTKALIRLMELMTQYQNMINGVLGIQKRAEALQKTKQILGKVDVFAVIARMSAEPLVKQADLLRLFLETNRSTGKFDGYVEEIPNILSHYKNVISEKTQELDGLASEPNTTVKTEPGEDSTVTGAVGNAGAGSPPPPLTGAVGNAGAGSSPPPPPPPLTGAVGIAGAGSSPPPPPPPPPRLSRLSVLLDNATSLFKATTPIVHPTYDTRKRLQQLIDGNNELVNKEALYRKQGHTLSSTTTLTAPTAPIDADSAETRNNVLAEGEEMAAIRGIGKISHLSEMDRFLINEPLPQKRIIPRFAGAGPIYSADAALEAILTGPLVFNPMAYLTLSSGPTMDYSDPVFYAAICMAAPTILHDFFLSPRVHFSAPGVSHQSVLNVQKSMARFLARIGENTEMKNFVDTIGTGAYFLAETYFTGRRAKLFSIEGTLSDIDEILTFCNTSALINHNPNGLVCFGTENSSAVAEAVEFININSVSLSINVGRETIIKVQASLPVGLGPETHLPAALLEHVRSIWRSKKTNKPIN
jgi:hypothetical protein